jgi:uroporphyrinogen decarboxylase
MSGAANSLFARAARREPVDRTPIWLMRQAGRVLPEYRSVRKRYSLLDICREPALCAEVTLQPLRRMALDAAVLFSDIMLPLIGARVDLEIVDGVGPVIRHPIRTVAAVQAIRPLDPDADLPFVAESIRLVADEIHPHRAVLGFAGAPFTLASYLIEGKSSRQFLETRRMMYTAPELWHALMDRLTRNTIASLESQIAAGADAVQLFDSWIGALGPDDYREFVQPYSRRIFSALRSSGVPLIHFGTNTAGLLDLMRDDGATIIGLDWRVSLDEAWARIGYDLGVQGNLDPAVLLAPPEIVRRQALTVLERAGSRPGHIFNLGHGLLPETPVENVELLVDWVAEQSLRMRSADPVLIGSRGSDR